MKNTPDNQGGARAGAGRKTNESKGLERLTKLNVGFTAAQLEFLRRQAVERRLRPADVVRALVDKAQKSRRVSPMK